MKRGGDERGGEGGEGRGGRRREGRRGLSDNVAEEAFCIKSAPGRMDGDSKSNRSRNVVVTTACGPTKWLKGGFRVW